MRQFAIFTLVFFLATPLARGNEMLLHAGSHTIHAELASTPQQREQGLMHRRLLCTDCGMLFIFPSAARHSFWMKNTALPLSIAFIAPNGRVINIAEMQPDTVDLHTAEGDALFALEMNRGWFTQHGIKAGDTITDISHLTAAN